MRTNIRVITLKVRFIVLGFLILLSSDILNAQEVAPPPTTAVGISRRMFIDPSATTVSLGKVNLLVRPLTRKGKFYVGDYQLKVVPYFFKSEKGMLELEAPDEDVQKLAEGIAVDFKGKATNTKNGRPKAIIGKITPSDKVKGTVIFSVETDNGQMVFKTSYHFAE